MPPKQSLPVRSQGTVTANGVSLWFETFGSAADPAIVLIMGLGAQATAWPDGFCAALASAGRYVIRYDNRDVGLSQWFDGSTEPYSLDDMARDAVGVLDALGLARVHVVGASMGGMIAQLVALDQPGRIISLTSIMSTPGGPDLEAPQPDALALLGRPPAPTRDERIAAALAARRVLAGGGFPEDDEFRKSAVTGAIDRAFHPDGTVRQMYAVVTAPPRAPRLAGLTVPTLVIHGTADPLVPFSHGVETAKLIPGAELLAIEGMGHELPPSVWERLAGAIVRHSDRPAAGESRNLGGQQP